MVSRIEPSENRHVFKKRSLRPWKPVIELDNAIQSDPKTNSNLFENSLATEFPLEILHQSSESNLETATLHCEDIRGKLSHLDNTRITMGGFFKPKNILLLDEQGSSEKTFFLLNALKDKEHQLATIQHQLKLAEALDEAKRNTIELSAEQKARFTAEESLLSTQKQMQQAIEYSQSLEERLNIAEQIKNNLEHRVLHLEKTIQESSQNFEAQLQATAQETDLRKRKEEEFILLKMQSDILETELNNKIQIVQDLQALLEESRNDIEALKLQEKNYEKSLLAASEKWKQTEQKLASEKAQYIQLEILHQQLKEKKQNEIQELNFERKNIESQLMAVSEKLWLAEQGLVSGKTNYEILETQHQQLKEEQSRLLSQTQNLEQELNQEKNVFQNKLATSQEWMEKINSALQIERNLRQHLETVARETEQALVSKKIQYTQLEDHHQQLKEKNQNEIQELILEGKNAESQFKAASEKLWLAEQSLASGKVDYNLLETQYLQLNEDQSRLLSHVQTLEQAFNQERCSLQNKISSSQDWMEKANSALQMERNLRQQLEATTKELAGQIFNLELRIQHEAQTRKQAEEKAKNAIARASEAVLNLLNQSETSEAMIAEK